MAAPEGYTKLGKVGFNYRGEYDPEANYDYHDVVYYQGSTYVALCSAPPFEPREDGINWRFIARGTIGEMIESYADLMANTVTGYMADALAIKKGFESVNEALVSKTEYLVSDRIVLQKYGKYRLLTLHGATQEEIAGITLSNADRPFYIAKSIIYVIQSNTRVFGFAQVLNTGEITTALLGTYPSASASVPLLAAQVHGAFSWFVN